MTGWRESSSDAEMREERFAREGFFSRTTSIGDEEDDGDDEDDEEDAVVDEADVVAYQRREVRDVARRRVAGRDVVILGVM